MSRTEQITLHYNNNVVLFESPERIGKTESRQGSGGGRTGGAGAGVHPQKFIFIFLFFASIREEGGFFGLVLIV